MQEKKPHPLAAFWLLLHLCEVQLFPVFAIFRRGWGDRFAGVHALAAVIWPLLWMGSFPNRPAIEYELMYAFAGMYVVLMIGQKIDGVKLRRRGYECHSQFIGRSVVGYAWEPFICLVVGGLLWNVSQPLGAYLMMCCPAYIVWLGYYEMRDKAKARAARDARFENEALARQLGDE